MCQVLVRCWCGSHEFRWSNELNHKQLQWKFKEKENWFHVGNHSCSQVAGCRRFVSSVNSHLLSNMQSQTCSHKHAVTMNHVVIPTSLLYSLHRVPSCLIWKWFCVDVQTTVSCLCMTLPACFVVVLFLCMEWIYQMFWNYTCLEFSSLSTFFLYEILPAILSVCCGLYLR